jgi:ectoine hydroxylase-related dioxygenase (phytanoyl-CoA dioxygenase family)
VECGFLTSLPGARAQTFHADTTPPSQRACEAQTIKVQLALVDVGSDMGPFEVVPRSHLAPAPAAAPKRDPAGGAPPPPPPPPPPPLAVRVLVGPGDVTVYSTNVQHRGSANTGTRARPTFHIAVIGNGAAPTGIPYTVLARDIREMYPERA